MATGGRTTRRRSLAARPRRAQATQARATRGAAAAPRGAGVSPRRAHLSAGAGGAQSLRRARGRGAPLDPLAERPPRAAQPAARGRDLRPQRPGRGRAPARLRGGRVHRRARRAHRRRRFPRGAGARELSRACRGLPLPRRWDRRRPGRSRRPMATASRSRAPAATKQRPRVPLAALAAADAARSWGVPVLALAVIALLTALSAGGAVGTAAALAGTVAAALVLLLYIGERPLVTQARSPRERGLGAGLALVWFVACYGPFHARLFPGTPLLDGAQVTAAGRRLPLRIPAAGRPAPDPVPQGPPRPHPS